MNYFNNEEAELLFLDYRDNDSIESRNKLILMSQGIISGVINVHNFDRFMPKEELIAECTKVLLEVIKKYKPGYINEKGKVVKIFTYISLIVKNVGFWTTKRNQANRNEVDYSLIDNAQVVNKDDFTEDLIKELCGQLRFTEKHLRLTDILEKYLLYTRSWDKAEFFNMCHSYGYSPAKARKYLKFLKEEL